MTSRSIRARLLASIAAIQISGAVLATYLVVEHERYQSYLTFDANLGEQSAVLRSLVEPPEEASDAIVFHREFLALPRSDKFYVADTAGKKIDSSDEWQGISPLPRDPRSVVNVEFKGRQYRALVLQRLPIVDPESAPSPASPTLTLVYARPTAPVEAHIRRVEFLSISACVVFLALSTIFSAWALTRGLRPLSDLASSARRIDVDCWKVPVLDESKRFSELSPLAFALTDLVDRLHLAFDRERQFFGDAAHEMKSSVAIVRSTLQFALQTDRSASEYRVELSGALDDTGRLQKLVASMLALARIESISSSASVVDPGATEVHFQVKRVADRFESLAGQKAIRIKIDAAEQAIWVAMPEDDFFTVVSNLVENAISYSNPGQQVSIRVRAKDGLCFLSVIDEGCGIAPSAVPHIFDRFYRADESRARATGGVGLGLSIAKALVLRAGGTLSVQSEFGKGAVFSVAVQLV